MRCRCRGAFCFVRGDADKPTVVLALVASGVDCRAQESCDLLDVAAQVFDGAEVVAAGIRL
jgi:hypothetical protein